MLPLFGGKLKIVTARRRSARAARRRSTIAASRSASSVTRSSSGCMQARPEGQASSWREQMQALALAAPSERPPKTMEPIAPSSSGIATISVVSIGVRPWPDCAQASRVWNSVTKAEK